MASIKLNTSSGGSITLQPSDTANNVVIDLPNFNSALLTSADLGTTVQAYDATILKATDIGTSVQAYDADLTAWSNKTTPTGTVVGTTDTQTLTNKTLTTVVSVGTREVKSTSSNNNFDLSVGNYFTHTLSGATSLTVSNVASAGIVSAFVIDLTNGGSAIITWWSGVKWAGGSAPSLTTSGRDILGFFTHDGGTTWNGLVLAKDVK